jgi:hypothetical protein
VTFETFEDFLEHFDTNEEHFAQAVAHKEMSDEDVDAFLAHYGIKGMKWGKRKARYNPVESAVEVRAQPGRRVEARGGQGQPAHEDAISTAASKQKARMSTVDALSTPELKKLVERMQLESNYAKLVQTQPTKFDAGKKFVGGIIKDEAMSVLKGRKGPIYSAIESAKTGGYQGKHRKKQ